MVSRRVNSKVGFTVIKKVSGVPTQSSLLLVKVGVTINVSVAGAVPLLTAWKEAMSPTPLTALKPRSVRVCVQAYVVVPSPVRFVVNRISSVFEPLQSIWSATGFTWAAGLTVTVKFTFSLLPQETPLNVKVGTTVKVVVSGVLVVFVSTSVSMSPVPDMRPVIPLTVLRVHV